MHIAVDIGNSCLKFGVFSPEKGNEMVGFWRLPSVETGWINGEFLRTMTCLGFLTNQINPPGNWAPGMADIYSKPLTWHVAQTGNFPLQKFKTALLALRPKDKFKTVTRRQIPIKKEVDSPETVGIDRLLAAFAAVQRYGNTPMLIVDVGSAITVDVVRDATFCGGAILPGLSALSETYPRISKKLPRIAEDAMVKIGLDYPGKNTKSAVFSGIYWGTIGAIRQFHAMFPHTMFPQREDALLILTGGDAELFLHGLRRVIPIGNLNHHKTLVLEGINLLRD